MVANGHKRAAQTINGADDITVLTLNEFARHVWKGVPQALEALYSPAADEAPLDAYRHHFYPDTARTAATYRRTIKSFALGGTVKKRRHALRLAVNLTDLLAYGRFTPALPATVAADLTAAASSDWRTYLDALWSLCPVDPFEDKPEFQEVLRASFDA